MLGVDFLSTLFNFHKMESLVDDHFLIVAFDSSFLALEFIEIQLYETNAL